MERGNRYRGGRGESDQVENSETKPRRRRSCQRCPQKKYSMNIEVRDTRIQGGGDEGVRLVISTRADGQAAGRRDSVRSTKSREMLGRGDVARKGRVRIL